MSSAGRAQGRVDPRIAHTRRVVTEAAAALLASEGFERATIDAIADRSGVSRSTIYRHWPDRADLMRDAFSVVCAYERLESSGILHVDLRAKGRNLARGLVEDAWGRMLPALVSAADHDDDLRRALTTYTGERRADVAALVAGAIERGEARVVGDLRSLAERFAGPFFLRRLMTGDPLDDAFVEDQVRSLCAAVGAPYEPEARPGDGGSGVPH